MYFKQVMVSLLLLSVVTTCVLCRTHVYPTNDSLKNIEERLRRSLNVDNDEKAIPFNPKNMERMLEKAILKIIVGNLSTGDMLLLKSLNYTLEEVLAIRERELSKKINDNVQQNNNKLKSKSKLSRNCSRNCNNSTQRKIKKIKIKKSDDKTFDIDAYNRQAVYDYENLANKMEDDLKLSRLDYDSYEHEKNDNNNSNHNDKNSNNKNTNDNSNEDDNNQESIHSNFDRAMKPHIIFKIRYEDLDLNSTSMEMSNEYLDTTTVTSISDMDSQLSSSTTSSTPTTDYNEKTFPDFAPLLSTQSEPTIESLDVNEDMTMNQSESRLLNENNERLIPTKLSTIKDVDNETITESQNGEKLNSKRGNEYEGLEWIEDDVYRVIPEALNDEIVNDASNNSDNQYDKLMSDEIITNDDNDSNSNGYNYDDKFSGGRGGYQEDLPQIQMENLGNENSVGNMTSYQQLTLAHRRDGNQSIVDSQGQKAIEDIKLRVLAMTGRFNLSSSSNQIQRERLTMFSPTCQIPRNTDIDVWSDTFAMNMHFQLNLTSDDHVVAAKLRIYKLPQNNLTTLATVNVNGTFDDDEEEEKKIRISIFFYTKSLKKHRSKKRLMDSVVTSLTPEGGHLALDVRQALRFWRQTPRSHGSNTNNHGLVVQIEDQDGRPLKPALYIQQDACHTNEDNADDKAYQRVPALFLQACSRYVRVVKGETVTYVNCKHLRRNRYQHDNTANFT